MSTEKSIHGLKELLVDPDIFRTLEDGIYSVLAEDQTSSKYDSKAHIYDWVIGNRFYNRIIWGNWPSVYANFAKKATSSAEGWQLDIGGGSMIFTAEEYNKSIRPIIIFDRSYGMLQRAKKRLIKLNKGQMPEHIFLLQGDLFKPPFKAAQFKTITLMGMLHIFEKIETPLNIIEPLLAPQGGMYMTSLVKETKLAEKYLNVLHKAEEVATPRSTEELQAQLSQASDKNMTVTTQGNMAYVIAS